MKEKTKYWLELSDYDIETASAMLESGRFLYVGFMCHQAIEKILKDFYFSFNETPAPYTHSLLYIVEKCGLKDKISEEQNSFLNEIEPLNIEARYPSHKKELLKSLNKGKCVYLIDNSIEFIKWVKTKL